MTKEQAIDIIKCLAWHYRPDEESIEQAINALEQQPSDETIKYLECNDIDVQKFTEALKKQPLQVIKPNISDDCVSREAVLDLMQLKMGGKELYKAVYDLPPVTPTQSWIPVSERLPKEDDDYLVTISTDIGAKEPVREVYKDFFCILSQQWLYYTEDVIAWQPLPKPYEEKRGSENEVD